MPSSVLQEDRAVAEEAVHAAHPAAAASEWQRGQAASSVPGKGLVCRPEVEGGRAP